MHKNIFYDINSNSYSKVTVYGTWNVMKHDKHHYSSKYMNIVHESYFLCFFDVVFLSMLFRKSLNNLKRHPVTPVTRITRITFVFTLKVGYICVLNYLYSEIFSILLLIAFLSLKIAMNFNIRFLFIITDYNFWKSRKKTQSTIYLAPRQATCFNQTLSSWSCPQERKD